MANPDDCAICYQKQLLPLELSCRHSFCFMCIKGVHESIDPALCPICRHPIDDDLFNRPHLPGRLLMHAPRDSLDASAVAPVDTMNAAPTVDLASSSSTDVAAAVATKRPSSGGNDGSAPKQVKIEITDNSTTATEGIQITTDNQGNVVVRPASMQPPPTADAAPVRTVKAEPTDGGGQQQPADVKPVLGPNGQVIAAPNPTGPTPPGYWLYKGRGDSWWRFEPRQEKDLETAFQAGQKEAPMIICGRGYNIDLEEMIQRRTDDATRTRQVKRVNTVELSEIHVKGIAGVRLTRQSMQQAGGTH